MMRYDDEVCGEIKTPVPLVVRRITKENTKSGTWRKFICGRGRKIGLAFTPKNA
jgi:hypothetical protein